jgi:hypothetical protein
MLLPDIHDPRRVLDWTAVLISIPVLVGTLEDLVRYRVLSDDGLMSWKVARLGHTVTAGGRFGALADAFLSHSRYRYTLLARLCAVFVLAVPGLPPGARAALFLFMAVSLAADILRSIYGHSGAQQMMICVCAALAFANAVPDGHVVQHMSLWFIALQSVLAYVTSGWAKLGSAVWRNGEGLVGIMRTSIYGHPGVYRLLAQRPWLARVASWSTFLFESSFFVVLVAGQVEVTLAFLAVAALFHLTVAVVMGLNLFLWAFVATYPALLFCT